MRNLMILRMNLLGGMNDYVCNHICDENAWLRWINLVPDQATEEDLQYIAEDEELFVAACELFGYLVSHYE